MRIATRGIRLCRGGRRASAGNLLASQHACRPGPPIPARSPPATSPPGSGSASAPRSPSATRVPSSRSPTCSPTRQSPSATASPPSPSSTPSSARPTRQPSAATTPPPAACSPRADASSTGPARTSRPPTTPSPPTRQRLHIPARRPSFGDETTAVAAQGRSGRGAPRDVAPVRDAPGDAPRPHARPLRRHHDEAAVRRCRSRQGVPPQRGWRVRGRGTTQGHRPVPPSLPSREVSICYGEFPKG